MLFLGYHIFQLQNWLDVYLIWPLRPYTGKLHRILRKEPKWYFLDWTFAGSESSRFENMIASALYRFVTSLNDRGWPEVRLHFVRTYDKKEIDFILTLNEKPVLAIEAKLTDAKFSPQLRRFRKAVDGKFPILQVVSQPGIFLKKGPGEYLVGYDRLLMAL